LFYFFVLSFTLSVFYQYERLVLVLYINYQAMKIIKGNFAKHNKEKDKQKEKLDKIESEKEQLYANCLLDLATPFITETSTVVEKNMLIYLAYISWNLAISKQNALSVDENLYNNIVEKGVFNSDEKKIIYQMVETKNAKYANLQEMIEDIDIEMEHEIPYIQVYFELSFISDDDDIIPFDKQYEGEEEEEDEDFVYNIDENQFKPGYLNRNAVIIHYKQPFVDLFNETHDPSTTRYRLESTVYLIDTMFSPQQRLDWLKKNHDKIFTNELREQGISLVDWPKKRTFKVFSLYFDAEFKVTAFDFEKQPITKF